VEITALSAEQWRHVVDVDLAGVFNCMQPEIEAMLGGGGGAIVNTASSLGLVGIQNQSAYSGAKHGVIGLTKSAALEYAARGVRINAICPGIVDTPMTARLLAEAPGAEEMLPLLQPIGRLGRPAEIAAAALFLLSDAASFVVGAALPVDGGHVAH
jgi:NAD(P)-dependent dehydrogenase (short-subunit alcohol dehydrogenase family)